MSGTREGFFSHRTICHKTQKQTEWWMCAFIVMRQYYKHHWKTVLNLINNSQNCAGTNSSNFTSILSFHRSKSHSFQNPGFPGFLFSATRNPCIKILPRIGNTRHDSLSVSCCPPVLPDDCDLNPLNHWFPKYGSRPKHGSKRVKK